MPKKNSNRRILKKELIAASLIAFMGMAGKQAEAKNPSNPEIRVEVNDTPEFETEESSAYFSGGDVDERYVYDSRLSRGLSIKYSGAFINQDTGEVILKAASRYDEDAHYSSYKSCLESQRHKTGAYDRSRDNEIRREQIRSGEYNYANEDHYIYSVRLSRGLSVKYSGAYINSDTGEVLLKAASRYDDDAHYSSEKNCLESQKHKTGPYDRSNDRELRREQIMDGEYNGRAAARDVIRGIGEIIRNRRSR